MTAKSIAIGAGVCLAAGAVVGILAYRHITTPRVTIIEQPGPVRTVLVDRPTLETRDVVRYVTDRAEVARLMTDLAAAHQQITFATETIAVLNGKGAGTVTYVNRAVPGPERVALEAHFRDWRLTFDSYGKQGAYTLSQRFEALTAVGRTRAGQPTATTRLFEVGPGETRTPLTITQQTVVAATPDAPRWHLRAAVTAGAGYAGTLAGWRPGGVVGLRWLSYGTSKAAEDERWSIATPALWLDGAGAQVGMLPISVNLGQIQHQPFRDLWVGPFIGVRPVPLGVGKVGIVLHATF
jgi:hypothetical protein